MMKVICPVCDNEKDMGIIDEEREISIRNEPIKVNLRYHKCPECDEKFIIPGIDDDPIENAVSIYRSRHNLLMPEEIRAFREKYDMTQNDLASILGFGLATISRYESGKLQDESQDRLIRLAMDSSCLKKLVENSEGKLSNVKKRAILNRIEENSTPKIESLKEIIVNYFESQKQNEFCGFKRFDENRFVNSILYFCKEGVVKTKLNKLMFYADFLHCKEYSISITGTQYAHIPFGPAPNNFDIFYPVLIKQGLIEVHEIEYPEFTGEEYVSQKAPDLNIFLEHELRILAFIKERFGNWTAKQISGFSHDEAAYKETKNGDIISYIYAKQLNLSSI
jgi:putative zinc finger/helix-turn-helix YgiT family protein